MKNENNGQKIILSGLFGENNAGDDLLLKSLITGLFDYLTIDKLVIFSANTSNTIRLFEKEKIFNTNIEVYYSGRWGLFENNRRFPKNLNWILATIGSIRKCDLIITGPGNIIKDNTNAFFLTFWLIKVFIAYIFSKKYCFLAIGAMDLKHIHSKILFYLLRNKCFFFSTRDTFSSEILRKLKVKNDKIFSFSDLCFYSNETNFLSPVTTEKRVIGINLRSFKSKHYSDDVIKNYYSVITNLLCYINQNDEFIYKFIPFCTEDSQNDLISVKKIESISKPNTISFEIVKWNTFAELEEEISNYYAFIGTRFHSNCISIKKTVPLLALSYDDKTYNLLKDIDMLEYCVNVSEISFEKILQVWESIERNRGRIISQLKEANIILSSHAKKHFELLKDIKNHNE